MFKVSRGLNPEIVNELFQFREQIPYELRQTPHFQITWVHSVFSGTERNDGNLHPVLANYAKDIFIGLGFFKKKLF